MNKDKIIKIIKDNNINNSYIYAEFYDRVRLGYYKDNEIYFNDNCNYDLLLSLKVFNKDLELRIDKDNSRVIKDDDYNNKYLNDEYMYIAGNEIVNKNDNFITIRQNGGNIDIPLFELKEITEDNIKKGISLIVRNYIEEIDESNIKQLIIGESRLVDICIREGN